MEIINQKHDFHVMQPLVGCLAIAKLERGDP